LTATLRFLGAASTVTGSKHLLDSGLGKLMVDCGLFQGPRELRDRNWQKLPIEVPTVSAVVLSHAHVDHCGYLPRLCADGFTGRIHATPDTNSSCASCARFGHPAGGGGT